MADNERNPENNEQELSFAELIESYDTDGGLELKVGDKVKGKIVSIDAETVYIETGSKFDGAAEKRELLNDKGELELAPGDEIELYVVGLSRDQVRLSRALSGIGGIEMLSQAYENNLPVEGKVAGTCKGGFNIEVMHRRGFCPISQIDARYVESPEDYVGQTLSFAIIKFEQNGRNIVLSRRKLLEKEQAENRERMLAEIAPGDALKGKIIRLTPFGAFVELSPGVEGMVHVSELGWSRIESPDQAVSQGDEIDVKILAIETHEKTGQPKISLSVKQLTPNPWLSAGDNFQAGESVQAKITRLAKFGAFAEIAPGIEGLIHISEMSYLKRINKPEEIVQTGQVVTVKIKEIDLENQRISLSLKDAAGDPWDAVLEKYKPGTTAKGTIEKRERFGLFVNLEPGVTGLMPKSMIARSENPAAIDKLEPGQEITFRIEEINPADRKMTLAPADSTQPEDWKGYAEAAPTNNMGSLGALLKQAMKKKK